MEGADRGVLFIFYFFEVLTSKSNKRLLKKKPRDDLEAGERGAPHLRGLNSGNGQKDRDERGGSKGRHVF